MTMGQLGKDKAQIKATFDMFDLDHDVRGHRSTAKAEPVMFDFFPFGCWAQRDIDGRVGSVSQY